MITFVGIDCGLTGAIAVLAPGRRVSFIDTPTFSVSSGGTTKNEYDAQAIVSHLRAIQSTAALAGGSVVVAIERQQAMPAVLNGRQQGTVSSFRTGMGYGLWLGVLAALGLPYEPIAPVSWKAAMMRDMGKEKGASIIKAKQLFPEAARQLTLVKHHGRADALLLAAFLERKHGAFVTPTERI